MENYKTTNVYRFLSDQYEYITGDLDTFHKVCIEIERQEASFGINNSSAACSLPMPNQNQPTVTTETTKSPADNNKLYRLTIPITLSLFATIDSVGFLSGDNDNPNETEKNFKEFFKQSPISVSIKDVELINYIFRQGLSHIYFPKLNLGISYHSMNPEKLIFRPSNQHLTLNVNMLEKIVVRTFELVKEKSDLYEKMERKYQDLIYRYMTRDGDKIFNYDS